MSHSRTIKSLLLGSVGIVAIFVIIGVFGSFQSVSAQVTCNDSDGDNDIAVGTPSTSLNISQRGTCMDYDGAGDVIAGFTDVCRATDDVLVEFFCQTAGSCASVGVVCTGGTTCQNSACVSAAAGGGTSGGLVPDCGSAGNPCGFDDLFVLMHNIVEFLILIIAPVLVVLMISFGGFTIMASRGNPAQFATGKSMITWALIGYIVILLAWVIVNIILTSIGVASWVGIGDWWNPTF